MSLIAGVSVLHYYKTKNFRTIIVCNKVSLCPNKLYNILYALVIREELDKRIEHLFFFLAKLVDLTHISVCCSF